MRISDWSSDVCSSDLYLAYASTFWGIQRGLTPLQILQSVAAGWLGRATFEGGYPFALLGLVSHYGIAITMAAVFWFASRRWPALVPKPLLPGSLYGLALYAVLTYVVVPLDRNSTRVTS